MKYLMTMLCAAILMISGIRHVFAAEHSSAGRSGGAAAHEHSNLRTQEHAEHTEHVEHESHQASIEDAVNAGLG